MPTSKTTGKRKRPKCPLYVQSAGTGISHHVIYTVLVTSGFPMMETLNTGVFVDSSPTFRLFIRHMNIVLYHTDQKYPKPTKQPTM